MKNSLLFGAPMWPKLILLVLAVLLLLGGQDAHAITAKIYYPNKTTYNIDESLEVSLACVPKWGEQVGNKSNWKFFRDSKDFVSATIPVSDSWDTLKFSSTFDLSTFVQGGSYRVELNCKTGTFWNSHHTVSSRFTINQLSGSYTATMNDDNTVRFTGTVGNGADEIKVWLNGQQVGGQSGLSSAFSFTTSVLPAGSSDLTVSIHYKHHSEDLPPVTVQSSASFMRPQVWLDQLVYATNNPMITLKGTASSTSGLKDIYVLWGLNGNLNNRTTYGISTVSKTITIGSDDGVYDFSLIAQSNNGYGNSAMRSVIVDRVKPSISISKPSKANGSVQVSATVTDDRSGIRDVQMCVRNTNKSCSSWTSNISGSQGVYTANLSLAGLDAGDITIDVRAKDRAGNTHTEPVTLVGPPVVSINDLSTSSNSRTVAVSGSASSLENITKAWIAWDKNTVREGSRYITIAPAKTLALQENVTVNTDGVYQFHFWAEAADGQTAVSELKSTLIDTTKPSVTLVSPALNARHTADFNVVISVTETGSGVDESVGPMMCWSQKNAGATSFSTCSDERKMQKRADGNYESTIAAANLAYGEIQVGFEVRDKAGNTTSNGGYWPDKKIFFIDDVVAPTIAVKTALKRVPDAQVWPVEVTVSDDRSGVAAVKMCARARASAACTFGSAITGDNGVYKANLSLLGFDPGDFVIDVWAQDKASNVNTKSTTVIAPPIVTTDTLPIWTKGREVKISATATSSQKIKQAWLKWEKDEIREGARYVADFPAASPITVNETVTVNHDGAYRFSVWTKSADDQETYGAWVSTQVDATAPTWALVSPTANSEQKNDFTIIIEATDAGSGIDDSSGNAPQICWSQSKNNTYPACSNERAMVSQGSGRYAYQMKIDDLEDGGLQVGFKVNDKVGNTSANGNVWPNKKLFTINKTVPSKDALSLSLRFVDSTGKLISSPFYADTELSLRIKVDSKLALKGMKINYDLPAGLSKRGKLVVRGGSTALRAQLSTQLQAWRDHGELLSGVDLPLASGFEIDIPVTVKGAVQKISSAQQDTALTLSGSNLSDTATAQTRWITNWKRAPQAVNRPLDQRFDLDKIDAIDVFKEQSGGYDTATPERWNRNTLYCLTGARCENSGDSTAITVQFVEQHTQKTIDIVLQGQRQLTTGSGVLRTALDSTVNAGADAEVRFSVWLPKEQLQRIQLAGVWTANLQMEMRTFAGEKYAFQSAIKLTVSDVNKVALTPPTMIVLPGSHMDKDQSGDYSTGDEVTYQIRYTARRTLTGVQMRYVMPAGLMHGNVNGVMNTKSLSLSWRGNTLENAAVAMQKGDTLTINVPVTIAAGKQVDIDSSVTVMAEGFDAMPSHPVRLSVTRLFAAAKGLTLQLTPEIRTPTAELDNHALSKATAIAQGQPFMYKLILTTKTLALDNLSLRYRLPSGLRRLVVEAPSIDAGTTLQLNTNWDGVGDDALLRPSNTLAPGQTVTINIPVVVKEVVGDGVSVRSEVSAAADNLYDAVTAWHSISVDERQTFDAQVTIEKAIDVKTVVPGGKVVYTIRLNNRGNDAVSQLLIRDYVAEHTKLFAFACSDGLACRSFAVTASDLLTRPMTYDGLCVGQPPGETTVKPDAQQVIWCIDGTLAPKQSYELNFTLKIDGGARP